MQAIKRQLHVIHSCKTYCFRVDVNAEHSFGIACIPAPSGIHCTAQARPLGPLRKCESHSLSLHRSCYLQSYTYCRVSSFSLAICVRSCKDPLAKPCEQAELNCTAYCLCCKVLKVPYHAMLKCKTALCRKAWELSEDASITYRTECGLKGFSIARVHCNNA